jgi:hypothetical protein
MHANSPEQSDTRFAVREPGRRLAFAINEARLAG